MKAIKVSKKNGNSVRLKLQKYIDDSYILDKTKDYLIFPIKTIPKNSEYEIIEHEFKKSNKREKFDVLLEKILTKKELEEVKTSRDVLGNIAILEIPDSLISKEKKIAEALLESEKQIKTVLKKASAHKGEFRTQDYEYLAGINTKETLYKENSVKMKFDVEKVFFSVRLSSERKRISSEVKSGENILVMFSGSGPYPCVLSKNTEANEIYGVELNPLGHKYAEENIKLNKITNVKLFNQDAAKIDFKRTFDRIVMPLPKDAPSFLKSALKHSHKGTKIHLYYFVDEDKIIPTSDALIKKVESYRKMKLEKYFLAGQHSPRHYRVCYDFIVE